MRPKNNMSTHAAVIEEVASAVSLLWVEGCPAARRSEEIAPLAVRRWFSSARRGVRQNDRQARIDDLVKGLIASFEPRSEHASPIRRDYECIAERAAAILTKSRA